MEGHFLRQSVNAKALNEQLSYINELTEGLCGKQVAHSHHELFNVFFLICK